MLAARYRVEVRDKDDKLVTVIEGDSKSFTMNFIKLLIASHYNQNDVPTFAFYDVYGNVFYTGNVQSPNIGLPSQIFNISFTVPGVWLGTSSCANPALASGFCGSIVRLSPYNLSPNAPCFGIMSCSPSLTEEGWTLSITAQWLNTSGSPVTVASMALVFSTVSTSGSEGSLVVVPYAAIIDNLPSPVTVWPGFLITVSYTIYFPV